MTSPLKLPDDAFGGKPPREVTVRTVMIDVTLVSLLFAAFALRGATMVGAFLLGLYAFVALVQRWIFRGRRPILASALAGGIYCMVTTIFLSPICNSPRSRANG